MNPKRPIQYLETKIGALEVTEVFAILLKMEVVKSKGGVGRDHACSPSVAEWLVQQLRHVATPVRELRGHVPINTR